MNKKLLLSLLAVGAIASGVLFKTSEALADDETKPFGDIVQRLSEKFGLEESEVQAVFDAVHDEHMQEMQIKFEERLSSLVSEGKLTEDQKNALIEKHKEMKANLPEPGEEPSEDMHEKMRSQHQEFKAWAEEQGIDLSLIGPMGFTFKSKGGHMGQFHVKFAE